MEGLPEIERVHAWIMVDDDGTEGIAGVMLPGTNAMTPLMCGDQPGAIQALGAAAAQVATLTGKPVRHYVFSNRHLVAEHVNE